MVGATRPEAEPTTSVSNLTFGKIDWRDAALIAKNENVFKSKAQPTHFGDGGTFDQFYKPAG